MKNKKGQNDILVLIIVVAVLVFGYILFLQPKLEEETFLTVRYYDENKDSIFSVVQGVENVAYIDLTVNLRNTGNVVLTCDVDSLSPLEFDNAITKTSKQLGIDSSVSWTSNLIETAFLESYSQPVRFFATVICTHNSKQITKSGYVDLTIEGDVAGDFDITIDYGDTPEDPDVSGYVVFRTTDLSYVHGSAIAFTDICGNELTAYGAETRGRSDNGLCEDRFDNPAILTNLPGQRESAGDGNVKLFADNTDPDEFWICENRDGSTSSSYHTRYDLDDSDASLVDTSAESINEELEISC